VGIYNWKEDKEAMNKIELMEYCWCRGFKYNDLLLLARKIKVSSIPKEKEYVSFCKKSEEKMIEDFKKQER
jgi:hypothetical protein